MYTDPNLLHRLASDHHRELLQAGHQARMVKKIASEDATGIASTRTRRGFGWLRRLPNPVALRPVTNS